MSCIDLGCMVSDAGVIFDILVVDDPFAIKYCDHSSVEFVVTCPSDSNSTSYFGFSSASIISCRLVIDWLVLQQSYSSGEDF